MNGLRKPGKKDVRRGAAVVEFAVLAPFLLLVFVIGIDWCRIYFVAHTLDDCARSGALAASGHAYRERELSNSERESRGKADAVTGGTSLSPALEEEAVTVSSSGDYVTVTVTYDFNTVTSYLGMTTYNVTRAVRMPFHP